MKYFEAFWSTFKGRKNGRKEDAILALVSIILARFQPDYLGWHDLAFGFALIFVALRVVVEISEKSDVH